ncbi:MAG: hypothetical protein HY809_02470, partial [Nitrospirae bacterium]|nr:hypothetical protein [Nitrospirota bacterium]
EKVQKCYRPIPALSYGIDYSIWAMDPFGYQLTNLVLHTLVSVLLFFFMRMLTRGRDGAAWLSAVLFALHPVMAESVPATVRRFDAMAALFILLSLITFLKHTETYTSGRKNILLSLFFYALALLTKEISVILPFIIIAAFVTLYPEEGRLSLKSLMKAVKETSPYIILTAIYIAWRSYVLSGIGGYVTKAEGIAAMIQTPVNIFTDYFTVMAYPVDFLGIGMLFSPYPGPVKKFFFGALLLIILLRAAPRKRMININSSAANTLASASRALLLFSLLCIAGYPLFADYINSLIQKAYEGSGPRFIAGEMNSKDVYGVETYIYKARDIILNTCFMLLIFALSGTALAKNMERIKRLHSAPFRTRLCLFLLIWMVLPLGIYLATSVAGRYYLYIPLLPFCGIISIMLLGGAGCGGIFTAFVLSVSLLWYSPLFRDYGEWKESGRITSGFLSGLSESLPEMPADASIRIHDYPDGIASYEKITPHAHEVVYMNDYNIKSWLNLKFPGNRFEVSIENRKRLASPPERVDIETVAGEGKDVHVFIKYYPEDASGHLSR